jgi:hypothetical protein
MFRRKAARLSYRLALFFAGGERFCAFAAVAAIKGDDALY